MESKISVSEALTKGLYKTLVPTGKVGSEMGIGLQMGRECR